MSGWVWEGTLKRMCEVIVKPYITFPYKVYPHVAYCDKEQLQELWDEAYEKMDEYYRLLEDPYMEVGLELEKYYLGEIEKLEKYIDEIDYQWSRFAKTDEELEAERLALPPLEPRVYGPDVRTLSKSESVKKLNFMTKKVDYMSKK
jgi:hypothetical protein